MQICPHSLFACFDEFPRKAILPFICSLKACLTLLTMLTYFMHRISSEKVDYKWWCDEKNKRGIQPIFRNIYHIYRKRRASRSHSRRVKISPSRTGPYKSANRPITYLNVSDNTTLRTIHKSNTDLSVKRENEHKLE